jgi:hypothetical protein
VHAPTAFGQLSALHRAAPDAEITADDIIKQQAAMLAASNARVQELELALNTITNLAGCAIRFMIDKGYGDPDEPDTIAFSRDYLDRMKDCNLTVSEDIGGGFVVRFRERADGPLAREQ